MPRLFVAIRPPEIVRDVLHDAMEGIDAARWQSDEQLHLTLRFVGDVDVPLANDLAAELARVKAAPFPLQIKGVGHFEKKGRIHTAWAGVVAEPELLDLQRRVERACRTVGIAPETRKFTPHVTLARLNSSSGQIGDWLAAHGALEAQPFIVREMALYESTLGREGSHYQPVVTYPL
ncbi:2'-5' RNA ligase [Altererythrobacter atlanticus]|uniref:RNA 2',3'-cyclic phosphodiesterase n=1 Tax=Croceibacterium atlanticum TaxID=1267766 RepID=A0A0F7KKU2_9SPHN|nr:RNA 2',3'-cyclic phosphodiesterase [Croceibacterium atlanticum]AKH41188.1 2'-5'-RNA ligase [Croceibacterium atlanticum]MBB5732705.1 2'-5' RNA ligase [Croceibacterium atlanticum]